MPNFLSYVKANWQNFLLSLAVLVYTIFFSWYTQFRHLTFKTYAFDLGVYCQALWSSLNGKLLYETPDMYWNPNGSFLGVHFAPFIFLLIGVYAIFPRPESLLFLQTVMLAMAAFPLYNIARDETKSSSIGLLIAFAFLLHPALHGINCFDFHLEAFTPIFLLLFFYYLTKDRFFHGLVSAILAMSTMDVVPVFVFFTSLSWLLIRWQAFTIAMKSKFRGVSTDLKLALTTMALSLLMFIIGTKVIEVFGPRPFTLGTVSWFPHLGRSINEILLNLFNIGQLIPAISYDLEVKVSYWLLLLAPLGFLPLFSPKTFLMALPWCMASILPTYRPWYEIGWHYPAFILPALFISTIYGQKNLQRIVSKLSVEAKQKTNLSLVKSKTVFILLVCSLILILAGASLSPLWFASPISRRFLIAKALKGSAYDPPVLTDHTKLLHKVSVLIPPNASVLTQNDLFPHLCHRFKAYVWLPQNTTVDYILIDCKSRQIETRIGNLTVIEMTEKLTKTFTFGTLASVDGILLLKRDHNAPPIMSLPLKSKYTYSNLTIREGTVKRDHTSVSEYIFAHHSEKEGEIFWYGPYITLPSGKYTVKFRLKLDKIVAGEIVTIEATSNMAKKKLAFNTIHGTDFVAPMTWQFFELQFPLDRITTNIEFRGINVRPNCTIYLDYIEVYQLEGD